jgi:hypothetical protein
MYLVLMKGDFIYDIPIKYGLVIVQKKDIFHYVISDDTEIIEKNSQRNN